MQLVDVILEDIEGPTVGDRLQEVPQAEAKERDTDSQRSAPPEQLPSKFPGGFATANMII